MESGDYEASLTAMAKAIAATEAGACGSFLQTFAGATMSKPSVIVETIDVDQVIPLWPRPLPRVRPVPVTVSSRRPLAQSCESFR